MATELAYFDDPFVLAFEARILGTRKLADGRAGCVLEKSYFYPTGGGQEHDTGFLGDARVIDVVKDEAGEVLHVVDREVPLGPVQAVIDQERRFGHMQHHSGQHILSQAILEELGLETVSVKISTESPSTLDLPVDELGQVELERAEERANRVVFENRPIRAYFVRPEEIHTIPLRRPPTVQGPIRVVEIEAFDYSACGGTHCTGTGMVGLIKIRQTERRNNKLRLHFVVGWQALRYFRRDQGIVSGLSRHFSNSPEEIVGLVTQQSQQLRTTQKELAELRAEMLPLEAEKLLAQAVPVSVCRLVTALYRDRQANELRALATLLQGSAGVIAFLASYDGRRLSLTVSCADDTGLAAQTLLTRQLVTIGGKGGGSAQIAQGGGQASQEQAAGFFTGTQEIVLEAVSGR